MINPTVDRSTVTRITDDVRRARLARRHLLLQSSRIESVPDIADAVVALHSSDPVTVYLAIAARSSALTVADIERALYDDRKVIRHHAMRRTLWVMTPDVATSAHAACTRKIAATERRRTEKLAGTPAWLDDAVADVIELTANHPEPLSTRQIGNLRPELKRDLLFGAGTRNEARLSAHTRAPLVAAFDGAIVRSRPAGTWIGSQYSWTNIERWMPIDWDTHDESSGTTDLVWRWLDRFGPGTLNDLVWWTGTTKTAVRRAIERIDCNEVDLSDGPGYSLIDDAADPDVATDDEPWVALLPGLDPTAMGWKDRAWYLDDVTSRRVIDRNGNIGPTVWADGRIVGGWVQRPDGEIATEFTVDVTPTHRAMIDDEAERLRSFIGDTRFRVRFPSPNQADLLA